MARPSSLLVAAAVLMVAAGPVSAEERGSTLTLPTFDAVAARGNFAVDIVTRQPQSVHVTGDKDALTRLRATVKNGTLDLELLPDPHPGFFRAPHPLRVNIALLHLDRVDLAGACELTARHLAAPQFALALRGASRAVVDGSVGLLQADLDGASHLSADRLTVKTATLALSGVSVASVHAVVGLEVAASGAARVVYGGQPRLTDTLSGVASVHHR